MVKKLIERHTRGKNSFTLFGTCRRLLAVALLLALLSGCGGGGSDSSDEGDRSSNACDDLGLRITNGNQCNPEESPVVVIVSVDASGRPLAVCSGSLITPNAVLTAAHCFEVAGTRGAQVLAGDSVIDVSSIHRHPRYNSRLDASPHDLAVIRLNRALAVQPLPLLVGRATAIGDRISVFGYGVNEDGESVQDLGVSALRGGFMQIAGFDRGLLEADFDDTGSSVCSGDSGGPAVGVINGFPGIVGVATAVTDTKCLSGTVAVFTDIQEESNFAFIVDEAPTVQVR